MGNCLGNVNVVVSDKKIPVDDNNDGMVDFYRADVIQAQDYYPGGFLQPGRNFNSNSYRFGHNGQEKTNEISGSGNHYTAEFWEYDPRTVRRWNVDPVVKPWRSPYDAYNNNPILNIDPNGDDDSDFKKQDGTTVHVEDGSTAQYEEKGNGIYKHYELKGFDITKQGKDVVNMKTLIQEAQTLNLGNSSLDPRDGNTYCNYGTQNIFKAINSATTFNGNANTQLPSGEAMANTMADNFATNPALTAIETPPLLLTYMNANNAAQDGKLVVIGYNNPSGHGHVGTLGVGTNFDWGSMSNIGAANGNIQTTNFFDKNVTPKVFSKTLFPSIKYYKLSTAVNPKIGTPRLVPPID